jgi:hypothetical protein
MSYGKIYRPNVRFVWTSTSVVRMSARVHVYPADAFLPTDGFLSSASMVKNTSADKNPSAWTQPIPPSPSSPSLLSLLPLPPSSPSLPSLLPPCVRADRLSPRGCSKNKIKYFFDSCCRLEKRKKNFGFRFSISKIPELRGLREQSCEKKKVFSA